MVVHGLDLSEFGTQVRSAVDVVWRGTPAFANETSRPIAEDLGLVVPSPNEVEEAAGVVEAACREFLTLKLGETLELPVARAVFYMRGWARLHARCPEPRPVSVCFGRALLKITDRQRIRRFWVSTEGRDGCLVVFAGRGRNCPPCHASRRVRWKTIEAEANATYRGLLAYPVWYPDGSTAVVRVGRCACGEEFQTSVSGPGLRQTRCDDCRRRHRLAKR